MKSLDNLRWSPKWVSHMGCIKGCLDYLGIEISDAWLYGGTGHAFILNIHSELCPSGPTAWKTMMLFEGGNNLGYEFDHSFGWKHGNEEFPKLQKNTWEFVKNSIDNDVPLYGWELEIPEFYVIYGYDDVGYYYSGPAAKEGKGPKPWNELGDTQIGLIEIYGIKPVAPKADPVILKTAIINALKHASNTEDWIFVENYASGLKGYDTWINALESGKADRSGMGYNVEVWSECRHYAVGFLEEAKDRLGDVAEDLFDESLLHYRIVADRLARVAELYPFIPPEHPEATGAIKESANRQEAVDALKSARDAEAIGMKIIERIAQAL
jgi:hypothetical protein